MTEIFIPILLGLLLAVPIVLFIRTRRQRSASKRPHAPEVPLSRQHRRAMERRENKGR